VTVLEAADLVVPIWRGREKLHYLNPVPIQEIYEAETIAGERHDFLPGDLQSGLPTGTLESPGVAQGSARQSAFLRAGQGSAHALGARW
jgi:hypothetical protein